VNVAVDKVGCGGVGKEKVLGMGIFDYGVERWITWSRAPRARIEVLKQLAEHLVRCRTSLMPLT
jgi:hypothetical protein